MTCLTAAHCDHLLYELGHEKCAKYGMRKSVAALVGANHARLQEILDRPECPFTAETKEAIWLSLRYSGRPVGVEMYTNFRAFAYFLSRRRYLPTSDFFDLLPSLEISHAVRMQISLTYASINPASLKRISSSGYVARTSEHNEIVVINHRTVIHAYSCNIWFKAAMRVLRWCSSIASFPKALRIKPANVQCEMADVISKTLARDAQNKPDYSFYAKYLLPVVAENIVQLHGYLKTSEADSDTVSDAGDVDCCPVCRSALGEGTVMLRCGHLLHADCRTACENAQFTSCPLCRMPFNLSAPNA